MADEPEIVTIPKGAYDNLTAIKALMDKAWDSKDTGSSLRKLLKQVDPTLKVPEDIADSVIAPVKGEIDEARKEVKGMAERLDKFLAETKDKDDTAALRKDLSAAQKKFGLDDEGLTKVMQRMKDKNNPDVEAAAAWVVSEAPKPKPISDHGITSLSADLFGTTKQDDQYKELQTGGDPFRPGGWFDREAIKILNEPTEQAA
jgi:hypothetical protein